ncbi:MAG: RDD family protein [Pseudobdellovibrionaceae bacterium]
MSIEIEDEKVMPERAPQKREAPLPFPRPEIGPLPKPSSNFPFHDLFKNNKILNFTDSTGFHGGPSARRKGSRLVLWSWLASFIDGLILISMSSIFIMTFSLIVRSTFGKLTSDLFENQHKIVLFLEVFFICGWVYMISIRSLMGSTIGEWSCNLRLGQPHERLQSNYIFRVALRSTLILFTGIVTLPILSLILGRDIAGMLSGLRLFSLK